MLQMYWVIIKTGFFMDYSKKKKKLTFYQTSLLISQMRELRLQLRIRHRSDSRCSFSTNHPTPGAKAAGGTQLLNTKAPILFTNLGTLLIHSTDT